MLNPIQDIIQAIEASLQKTPNGKDINVQVQLANQPQFGQFQSSIAGNTKPGKSHRSRLQIAWLTT